MADALLSRKSHPLCCPRPRRGRVCPAAGRSARTSRTFTQRPRKKDRKRVSQSNDSSKTKKSRARSHTVLRGPRARPRRGFRPRLTPSTHGVPGHDKGHTRLSAGPLLGARRVSGTSSKSRGGVAGQRLPGTRSVAGVQGASCGSPLACPRACQRSRSLAPTSECEGEAAGRRGQDMAFTATPRTSCRGQEPGSSWRPQPQRDLLRREGRVPRAAAGTQRGRAHADPRGHSCGHGC